MHASKTIRRLLLSFSLLVLIMFHVGNMFPAEGSGLALEQPLQQALLIIPNSGKVSTIIDSLKANEVRIAHQFPPDAFIIAYPVNLTIASLIPDSVLLFDGPVDLTTTANWSPSAYQAAFTWNDFQQPNIKTSAQQLVDENLLQHDHAGPDSFEAPPPDSMRTADEDRTPNNIETSQFLIGSIAVGLILPESNGLVDPSTEDWTFEERALVVSQVAQGLEWWSRLDPQAHLSFVYENPTGQTLPTGVEPIARSRSDQIYWIADTMTALGIDGSSYFEQVRNYNQYLRLKYQTDWAFTIFVADSSVDADNTFSDGYFGYAYLGGPFMVMTYGNQNYGIYNMNAVTAHEVGHIFRALDQYATANLSCNIIAGYLSAENQNSEIGCAMNQPSIMRGRITPFIDHELDYYGRGQVGWWDVNQNGIFDPIDTGLSTTNTVWTEAAQPNVLTITSHIEETPYPAPQSRAILINKLQTAWYRVENGPWLAAAAIDGRFDAYREDIVFTTDPLPTGTHKIYIKTKDNFGKLNEQLLTSVSTTDPVGNQLDTIYEQVLPQPQYLLTSEPFLVRGSANHYNGGQITQVEFRIDGQPWQPAQAVDGRFDSDQEGFEFIINTANLARGEHLIQARAIDQLGQIESTPARQVIILHLQPAIHLPLIFSD